jgi:polyvinyl alcohol dehydrogenase (cytochrome)
MRSARKKWRLFALTSAALVLTGMSAQAAPLPAAGPSAGSAQSASVPGDWPAWQGNQAGSRYAAAEYQINQSNVGKLQLKWAFAYAPNDNNAPRSQPAIVGGIAYFGDPNGKFYAVDARSGVTRWSYDLSSAGLNPGQTPIVQDSPLVTHGSIFFGDTFGNVYDLNQQTGKLLWAKNFDTFPTAQHTSSPMYYDGRIYVGTSSGENDGGVDYACCTFRGHIDAIDANTGNLDWRYYTMAPPQRIGTWPSGAAEYGPSGGSVWSSPVVDPFTGTIYVGTGNNYSGNGGDFDTLLALDARTGTVRWKQHMEKEDTWRLLCNTMPANSGYCPSAADNADNDYDVSSTPNIMWAGGRELVGVGQKSGVYHVYDAWTGKLIWQRDLSGATHVAGTGGVQWGSSYDGKRIYVATNYANPGTLYALDPATGAIDWQTPNPPDGCSWGGAAAAPNSCALAHVGAPSTSPGVVYEGSADGKLRAYSADTGKVLWQYDTVRDFAGVNGVTGHGGVLAGGGGVVIADGIVYTQAGYWPFYPSNYGGVLLAFALPKP